MAKPISSTTLDRQVRSLTAAVNAPAFMEEYAKFRKYADRQRPGLRRKLVSLSVACRRHHELRQRQRTALS